MGHMAYSAQVPGRRADESPVKALMRGLIDRTRDIHWRRAVRYAGVSVAGVMLTQVLLVAGHAVVGLGPATANTVAVLAASVPVYKASRAWVWNITGPSSLQREIVPFWAFTILGLLLSTLVVSGVGSLTESSLALSAANVTAFGVLWVSKFFVLDEVVFASGDDVLHPETVGREELLVA